MGEQRGSMGEQRESMGELKASRGTKQALAGEQSREALVSDRSRIGLGSAILYIYIYMPTRHRPASGYPFVLLQALESNLSCALTEGQGLN